MSGASPEGWKVATNPSTGPGYGLVCIKLQKPGASMPLGLVRGVLVPLTHTRRSDKITTSSDPAWMDDSINLRAETCLRSWTLKCRHENATHRRRRILAPEPAAFEITRVNPCPVHSRRIRGKITLRLSVNILQSREGAKLCMIFPGSRVTLE